MDSNSHPFALATGEAETTLSLFPVVDILVAPALHGVLTEALDKGKAIVLDGAPVERISTPAVQILLAAAKAAGAAKLDFRVQNPSSAMATAFADLGLATSLEQWSAAT